jgi:N-acetylglucosaminyldiphosphoundecaprenol N-acetyl-beta-D-mannosaminyltransferase
VNKRIRIGTIGIDAVTQAEALDAIIALVKDGRGGVVFTPNVDHVVQAERDAAFRDAYRGANLVLVDGTPVLWAARLLGTPLPEKLSGSDLYEPLLQRAMQEGLRVALVGGAPGVAERAARNLRQALPALRIVATPSPRIELRSSPEEQECVASLKAAQPDLVFVCFGAPKQELFSCRQRAALAPAVLLGFGATIDFAAGTVPRAPAWMSKAGLEWAFRLGREPRRLAARYLLRDPEFFGIVARQLWAARTQQRRMR